MELDLTLKMTVTHCDKKKNPGCEITVKKLGFESSCVFTNIPV